MKCLARAVAGLVLLIALTGCHSAAGKAPHPTRAEAASPFVETAAVEGATITLTIDPLKTGENRLIVLVGGTPVKAVEAQIIMASMGHGSVIELVPAGAGRFEAKSELINMAGRWIVRIKAEPEDGVTRTATYHLLVPGS